AVFKPHRPFLWSLNVGIKDNTADQYAPTVPGRIIYYAASGDGNYVATLSTHAKTLQLDMWDLEADLRFSVEGPQLTLDARNLDNYNEHRAPFTPRQPCSQIQSPILRPIDSDIFYDLWAPGVSILPCPLSISVSYDASKVVLINGGKEFLTETFQAYTFSETAPTTKTGVPPRKGRLSRITDEDLGVQLKDFRGFGKFHFTSPTEHDPQVELFITCDGRNVDIYNVFAKWEPIRRIPISNEGSILTNPRRIIEGLGGKYFSWLDKNNITYICDLEIGKIAYTMDSGATIYFSKDGSLMLCNEGDATTIRWTESGTMLATRNVEDSSLSQVFSAFIESGNRILVPVVKPDDRYGRGRQGMILDTTTLRPVERVSYSTRFHEQQPQTAGSRGQYLYSSHGSKLDLIRFQDITVAPYPQQRYECDDRCKFKLTDLQESEIIKETSNQKATVAIPNSDLTVTVGFQEVSLSRYAIVVSISDSRGESREVLQIPPLCIGTSCARYRIHVDEANLQLIADCQLIIM
ncbi:hypothetical protein BGX34_006352, partial [Mortierella sp. NVP85]